MARIAFLIPDLGGGGAERVALTLLEDFAARGHEIDLIVMQRRGELIGEVPPTAHLLELGVARIRNVVRPLSHYLRERRPDALQVSMWPLTITAIIAWRLTRSAARLVVSDHNALSMQYAGNPFVLQLLKMTTRLFYPLADARVVVAAATADDLAGLSGLGRERFEVIYNPVFARDAATTPEIETMWGAADGRIINVGSLKAQKNQALLIRGFAQVRKVRAARLMILGAGELEAELRQLSGSLGVADDVIFAGFVSNPWPYYASADLFALSSDYEGFGNVLVEAMHSGLPVVATDCESGPREILDGGRYGRLVPVGDERALADAMLAGLDRPTDTMRLRQRAEELSGKGTADRYLELLLGNGS